MTDAYRLNAAIRHGMKLLTFDKGLLTLLRSEDERRTSVEVLAISGVPRLG